MDHKATRPWMAGGADPTRVLRDAIADGIGSAASLHVRDLDDGSTLLEAHTGSTATAWPGVPINPDTVFDLASLTKLYSATAALLLAAEGALDLDGAVAGLLGAAARPWHERITVRDVLEHRSGLPAWAALWTSGPPLSQAAEIPPDSGHHGRARYSDIGFLLLLRVLVTTTGLPFDVLVRRLVLGPFGLTRTGYRKVGSGEALNLHVSATGACVATERCPTRGALCGEVHDENTWHLGGVAAHAGLFATAADVSLFAHRHWTDGVAGRLGPAFREIWADPRPGGTHVLGWDSPSGARSSAGTALSRRSRGHLGFTGTSLWVDPERRVAVALLTNRVHPSRTDERIRLLRPAIHDAVVRWLDLWHPTRPLWSPPA